MQNGWTLGPQLPLPTTHQAHRAKISARLKNPDNWSSVKQGSGPGAGQQETLHPRPRRAL